MAISNEEFNQIAEKLLGHLIRASRHGDEKLIRKIIDSMEIMWKEINEVLDPLWVKKEVVAIMRDNHRKKVLEGKKDV